MTPQENFLAGLLTGCLIGTSVTWIVLALLQLRDKR